MPKFYDKRSVLTAYAFACGYVEIYEGKLGRLTINREHGVYHIRGQYDNNRVWDTATNPRDARRLARRKGLRITECREHA